MKPLPSLVPTFFGFALSVACAFGLSSAWAADLANKPQQPPSHAAPASVPFNWTGLYAGITGGYAWGRSHWSDPAVGADSGNFDLTGGLLGAELGYNWQTGPFVLGLETDADWMHLNGSAIGGVCATDGGGQCQTQQNWFGTTRGRIGYAFSRWLPYITGGLAYGDIEAMQPTGSSSKVQVGWSAGAGMEFTLNHNWSAKFEYLHLDLGTATFFGAASGTSTLSVPVTDELVRAGVSYHW